MPRYNVSWTEEVWWSTYVEADNHDDALNSFFDNVDNCWDRAKQINSELQDSVEVEEVNE